MIAVFIIVVMSVIGAALIRLLNDSATSTVTEVYGARAFHAAQSGIDIFLTELFPHDSPTASCTARAGSIQSKAIDSSYSFNTPGLTNCSANIRCDELDLSPFPGRHFRILSSAQCTVDDQRYSRQLLVEARDD